jgi:hypothetical protein
MLTYLFCVFEAFNDQKEAPQGAVRSKNQTSNQRRFSRAANTANAIVVLLIRSTAALIPQRQSRYGDWPPRTLVDKKNGKPYNQETWRRRKGFPSR